MPNVANISRQHVVLSVKGGKRVSLAPGESRSLEIDKDSASIRAKVNARLIVVGGTAAQAEKIARTGTTNVGTANLVAAAKEG